MFRVLHKGLGFKVLGFPGLGFQGFWLRVVGLSLRRSSASGSPCGARTTREFPKMGPCNKDPTI